MVAPAHPPGDDRVMPRVFSFERALWEALDLVPMAVRRKLDLAELKLSPEGWQMLSLDDRRALRDAEPRCDMPAKPYLSLGCKYGARAVPRRVGVS